MCATFAETEVISLLAEGNNKPDVLGAVHTAIAARTLGLVSRVGKRGPVVMTGGVAKNEAAVKSLRELVNENYGDLSLNIDPDSIYTGALGGATFAWRAVVEEGKAAEAR